MAGQRSSGDGERLPAVGTFVEVLQHYNERWAGGFEVARIDLTEGEPAVALRRCSDGSILPATFHPRDLRRA